MQLPRTPADEVTRLLLVKGFQLLPDCLNDSMADVLTFARKRFCVPTVLISIVEQHRQIFAARVGLDVCETGREVSFCAHALGGGEILLVPDASQDERFADNPLVRGEPFIRFYAGVPLRASKGSAIGTLCLIDTVPHPYLDDHDLDALLDLEALVIERLTARRAQRLSASAGANADDLVLI